MSELCLSSSCLVEVRSGYPHASKSGISTVFAIIEIDWMQQNCKKMTKDGKKNRTNEYTEKLSQTQRPRLHASSVCKILTTGSGDSDRSKQT